ncbi:hypothetical protein [Coprothermobacter proteolyticus]|uniref:Uncharacterized protein n=1 Tax=Coprothermobacter proteolyticus (strain ATCC 35245 / DSM 5265 / OCM 4 / BT) TaxID=309798 RepID=B5Y6S8_COPPD|nr:hypothetical protein [Coprothermobacter proteolyticus]
MTEKQKAGMKVYYYVASFVLLMFVLFYASNLVSQLSGILVQPPLSPIRINYEDAKAQLLWEKYGPAGGGSVTPEEVKEFVIQRELQYRKVALRHNYSIAGRNAIYLLIMIPVYWHHWKVALSLE